MQGNKLAKIYREGKLEELLYGGFDPDELKLPPVVLSRTKVSSTSPGIPLERWEQQIQQKLNLQVSLPDDYVRLLQTIRRLYMYIPPLALAIQLIVDNLLSPDNLQKSSLLINADAPDDNKKEEIFNLVKGLIEAYNLERLLPKMAFNFVLLGAQPVEIVTPERILRKITHNQNVLPLKEVFGTNSLQIEVLHPVNPETDDFETLKEGLKESVSSPAEAYLKLHEPERVLPLYAGNVFLGLLVFEEGTSVHGGTAYTKFLKNGATPVANGYTSTQADKKVKQAVALVAKILSDQISKVKNEIDKRLLQKELVKLLDASGLLKRGNLQKVRYIPPEFSEYIKLEGPAYEHLGTPYVFHVLKHAVYLFAMEWAVVAYRLVRAADLRVFRVYVGSDPRVEKRLQEFALKIKRREIALKNGGIDALVRDLTLFDELIVPVTEQGSSIEVDRLPSGDLTAKIEDVQYIKKQLLSGLGIPPIYFGEDPGTESRYTLAQENVRFARTIVRLQKDFSAGLTSLIRKIYRLHYGPGEGYINVSLRPPKSLMLERQSEMAANVGNILQTLAGIDEVKETVDIGQLAVNMLKEVLDEVPLKKERVADYAEQKLKKLGSQENEEEMGL